MLSLGNELGGKQELMAPFVKHFRRSIRGIYTRRANNWFPTWTRATITGKLSGARKEDPGSFGTVDAPLGHVQVGPPSTMKDYTEEIAGFPVPVVSHEIAEYQTAPDLFKCRSTREWYGRAISKSCAIGWRSKGCRSGGAVPQGIGCADGVVLSRDIEAALRTPKFAGFQLLDLQDFPGQGTALVGILNAFMEPKGFISPEKWREFCSETVPLARFEKYTWTTGETFTAKASVAHYGSSDLGSATTVWTLRDQAGRIAASGRVAAVKVPQGRSPRSATSQSPSRRDSSGKVDPYARYRGHRRKELLRVLGLPEGGRRAERVGVVLTRVLDDAARNALNRGASVLLLPDPVSLPKSIEGSFASDFWNWGMFKKIAEERHMPVAPGTLGILCDPKHPALAGFPTDSHSNWQWFHLLMNLRALILDTMPAGFRPFVQVIDNFERAHKLGPSSRRG